MKHIISLGLHWREASHLLFGLSMLLVFILASGNDLYAGNRDHRDGFSPKTNPSNYGHRYSKSILRGVRLSDVYTFNDTVTTAFGPAYANVWTSAANFLQCTPPSGRPFFYALCYYSGPDAPTGNSDENPSLPCTLSPDGTLANCTCFEISTDEVSPKMSYLVDIHADRIFFSRRRTIKLKRSYWERPAAMMDRSKLVKETKVATQTTRLPAPFPPVPKRGMVEATMSGRQPITLPVVL